METRKVLKEHQKHNVVKILKSCITGKAIWIYMGPSMTACRKAYARACQKEVERIRHIGELTARRKANIMQLLNDCLAGQPIDKELPPEKKAAAKRLIAIAEQDAFTDRDFYDHIMARSRQCGKSRWRQAAAKAASGKKRSNRNYDK